jgi:hypothetical protein
MRTVKRDDPGAGEWPALRGRYYYLEVFPEQPKVVSTHALAMVL